MPLASSPTIAPHRTHIKLVSNRSLLGKLGGLESVALSTTLSFANTPKEAFLNPLLLIHEINFAIAWLPTIQ
ncbi:hypothetical protein [Helicobacter pylori]|uniref:hypothetical protein n=1 Tax=Helicobacter pylori TaxID=210 RepID=UPI001FD48716|nr:hypothetical protein [Helicobacter pylori]UOS31139.1 hypothetical protein MPG83_06255 [Helicobacter pylori]